MEAKGVAHLKSEANELEFEVRATPSTPVVHDLLAEFEKKGVVKTASLRMERGELVLKIMLRAESLQPAPKAENKKKKEKS